MKLVSWNCNMAFRKKWHHVLEKNTDILIIQECENKDRLKIGEIVPKPKDAIWIGQKETKGVGIFAYGDYNLTIHKDYNEEFQYIIPIEVRGKSNYLLFAIWAMPHKISAKGYVGQIWSAVQYYDSLFNDETILVGDFNSNVQWDYMRKVGNHTHLVDFLNKKNIFSLYHHLYNLKHGAGEDPTLYLLKQINKPYHLDFCFASKNLIGKHSTIEIGKYKDWIKWSDHMPLIIELNR